jgi:hypothetical protein
MVRKSLTNGLLPLRVPDQTKGKIRYRPGELAKGNAHRLSSELQWGEQAHADPGADQGEQSLGAIHQDRLCWHETGLQENRASPFEITGCVFRVENEKGLSGEIHELGWGSMIVLCRRCHRNSDRLGGDDGNPERPDWTTG